MNCSVSALQLYLQATTLLAIALAAGCVQQVPRDAGGVNDPLPWSDELSDSNVTDSGVPEQRWWQTFSDPALDQLIETALVSSLDASLARARLVEARANRNAAMADLRPTTSLGASVSHQRLSENSLLPAGRIPGFSTEEVVYETTFDAAWEIDLFGRNGLQVQVAEHRLASAQEAQKDVLLTLVGDIARTYFELRSASRELAVLDQSIQNNGRMLDAVTAKRRYGEASDSDLEQVSLQGMTLSAQRPGTMARKRVAVLQLSILTGIPLRTLEQRLDVAAAPRTIALQVPIGASSDVLRRRPDVRRAERGYLLEAAQARLSELALYPSFQLFGAAGYEAIALSDLLDGKSLVLNLGALMNWRLYDGGRRVSERDAARSLLYQAELEYRSAVVRALGDVEQSGTRYLEARRERDQYQAILNGRERLAVAAQSRYDAGTEALLPVLEAREALLEAERALERRLLTENTHLIAFYKALGGGSEVAAEVLGTEVVSNER